MPVIPPRRPPELEAERQALIGEALLAALWQSDPYPVPLAELVDVIQGRWGGMCWEDCPVTIPPKHRGRPPRRDEIASVLRGLKAQEKVESRPFCGWTAVGFL